jgi:beta-mannosidase
MSEFGFQSLPPFATIRTYADEADWNMTSYIMEQHQKNASGNSMMVRQMLDMFQLPKDFKSLVYLSMALQAEGIRYGVEHWRRHPDRVAGILYWQLNDCWPVASWSSLDYYGRWKALHYAARHFFAPLMLSIEDKPPEMSVYLSNDALESFLGELHWSLETLDGEELIDGSVPFVFALPQNSKQICKLDLSKFITEGNLRKLIFIADLWDESDHFVTQQIATFVPIKHLSLSDPAVNVDLSIENDQLIASLNVKSTALLVEVSLAGVDVVFSDNYFNLPAGRTVQISCPMPAGWTLERVKNELCIRSVYDSYSHGSVG